MTCPQQPKLRFPRAKNDPEWPELRREALAMLREGEKNRDIARALEVSEDTVSKWRERAVESGRLEREAYL